MATYYPLSTLLTLIEQPNVLQCAKLLDDNEQLFRLAQGSQRNHQAWKGGYWDHVTECMNYGLALYRMTSELRALPFTLGDLMLVLFLHDLEKPWRLQVAADGTLEPRPGVTTKAERKAFRDAKLVEYNITLTEQQANGLRYVEGELDDYSNTHRVMNELAAMAHMCDVWSARGWHDRPYAHYDKWGDQMLVRR